MYICLWISSEFLLISCNSKYLKTYIDEYSIHKGFGGALGNET
jgi:hypothetical protein